MKYKKIILYAILLIALAGCGKVHNSHSLIFEDDIIIEYGEDIDSSKFLKRVDSFLINDSMREKGKINVSNIIVSCPKLDTKQLGNIELVYKIDNEKYRTVATVKDTLKPVIELAKEKLTLIVGDKLDLSKVVKNVSDPIDGKLKYSEKAVEKDGYYFVTDKVDTKKAGTYKAQVIAIDKNGNKSTAEVEVEIKKKKVKKSINKNQPMQRPSNNSSDNNINKQDKVNHEDVTNKHNIRPNSDANNTVTKEYLFDDGYTIDTAPKQCQIDLESSGRSGACTPIQDANGIYKGMRLTLK